MLSSSIAGSLNNQLFKLYTHAKLLRFKLIFTGRIVIYLKRTEYLHSTVEAFMKNRQVDFHNKLVRCNQSLTIFGK